MIQHIHTGCNCILCKRGKVKSVRKIFHRKVRKKYKLELLKYNEIINVNYSIGFTD